MATAKKKQEERVDEMDENSDNEDDFESMAMKSEEELGHSPDPHSALQNQQTMFNGLMNCGPGVSQ